MYKYNRPSSLPVLNICCICLFQKGTETHSVDIKTKPEAIKHRRIAEGENIN